jgi:uncharacterized protein (TIGR00106 family)
MSVLLELSIFPTDQGESVSAYVAPVVAMIRESGVDHELTAMGTLIETETLEQGLALVSRAHAILAQAGCRRVYATLKLDSRLGVSGRLRGKVEAVTARIGEVAHAP